MSMSIQYRNRHTSTFAQKVEINFKNSKLLASRVRSRQMDGWIHSEGFCFALYNEISSYNNNEERSHTACAAPKSPPQSSMCDVMITPPPLSANVIYHHFTRARIHIYRYSHDTCVCMPHSTFAQYSFWCVMILKQQYQCTQTAAIKKMKRKKS